MSCTVTRTGTWADFEKFNDSLWREGLVTWLLFREPGDNSKLSLPETRLKLNGANPKAEFVQVMTSLSDDDFDKATKIMTDGAVQAYLYNKYPDAFRKIDPKLSGASESTTEDAVAALTSAMTERRDARLLLRLRLFIPNVLEPAYINARVYAKRDEFQAQIKRWSDGDNPCLTALAPPPSQKK